jgi:hypothetical protein
MNEIPFTHFSEDLQTEEHLTLKSGARPYSINVIHKSLGSH